MRGAAARGGGLALEGAAVRGGGLALEGAAARRARGVAARRARGVATRARVVVCGAVAVLGLIVFAPAAVLAADAADGWARMLAHFKANGVG